MNFPRNSTLLRQDTCTHCGQPILTGLDDPHMALTARLDPKLHTRDQALGAALLDRPAYRILPAPGHTWKIISNRYTARNLPNPTYDKPNGYAITHICFHPIPAGKPIRLQPQGGMDLFDAANQPDDPHDGPPTY